MTDAGWDPTGPHWFETEKDRAAYERERQLMRCIEAWQERCRKLERERDEAEAEVEHFNRLAFVDLGANPPVSWKTAAEKAERERDEARAERGRREEMYVSYIMIKPASNGWVAVINGPPEQKIAIGATFDDIVREIKEGLREIEEGGDAK